MSKVLAYSYVRMSTDLQLKGDSLRRQTDLSERYAQEHDLELVRDFELHDIGISAFKGANIERGALGQFLRAVEHGEVPRGSYLLVESLDRLSRQDISASVTLFLQITNSGINIVTLADGHHYPAGGKAELGQFIYSIVVMARANEESQIKSSRIAAAWQNKRTNIDSRVLTKWAPAWLQVSKDRSKFDALENRVSIVKRIFLAAAEGQGSGVITRTLNKEGVPAFGKSNGWLESYVTKILKNRAVLGEFQPHTRIDKKRVPDGPVIKGYFPKIIEEELFLKVQAGRRKRSVAGGGRRGPMQRNLFTHIAKCGYCGSPMRFINKGQGPKGGKYLRCSASVRGMECAPISWRYGDFETSFFSFVREFDLRSVVEDSHRRSEASILQEEIAVEVERLKVKENERARTFELLHKSSESSHEFLQGMLDQTSEEIQSVQTLISDLEAKKEKVGRGEKTKAETDEQLSALSRLSKNSEFSERLLVSNKLRELVEEIKLLPDGKKPKFEAAKSQTISLVDDLEEQEKILSALHQSHFSGPYSNPYFIVTLSNGATRTVVPDPEDSTKLIEQLDAIDDGVWRTGRAGQMDQVFGPRTNT